MKKVLIFITFLSMASIAIAQCPGSKAEEYKQKLQEHNSKSPREKAELPGMLGQAYSQAASYYMYKCMCENGYAKNEEGKKEIAAAANVSADYFNSANISGEPKLSKINPGSCNLAGKGKSVSGNESANYVVPEKGLFFNNRMMSNLNAIAAESDNEELKTIVKEMNEVHQNANYMRQNYGLDQKQTEMLNTWENIGQVATILVANSIKKDEEYEQQLRAQKKATEQYLKNVEYSRREYLSDIFTGKLDSLRLEYIYPMYLTKNQEFKKHLFEKFNTAISSYYPILDYMKDMVQDYYVFLNFDMQNNYLDKMKIYPFEEQKADFLTKWNRSLGDLIYTWDLDAPLPRSEKHTLELQFHHFRLIENEMQYDSALLLNYGVPIVKDADSTIANIARSKFHFYSDDYSNSIKYRGYIYILYSISNSKDKVNHRAYLDQKEMEITNLWRLYDPIKNLALRKRSDIGSWDTKQVQKMKKESYHSSNPDFIFKKYFSESDIIDQAFVANDVFLTILNSHFYNTVNEPEKAREEVEGFKKRLKVLFEISSVDEDVFNKENFNPCSAFREGRNRICIKELRYFDYMQLLMIEAEANIQLKDYTSARKSISTVLNLSAFLPEWQMVSNRIKFYPLYLDYLETGKINKVNFFNAFDNQLKILDLIEEWQVTHSDIEPILKFLN